MTVTNRRGAENTETEKGESSMYQLDWLMIDLS